MWKRFFQQLTVRPQDLQALVVGTGVAGSAAALRFASCGIPVKMISAATNAHDCNSFWAQGGIIYKGNDDPPQLLAQDVHMAGAGISYDPAVQKLVREGPARVEELLLNIAKTPFERDPITQELLLTLEASHSRARIVYKADHTGKVITTSLLKAVEQHSLIEICTDQTVIDVAKNQDGDCIGAHVLNNSTRQVEFMRGNATVLATGGLGHLYLNTSNPAGARGHGIAIAERAGAKLRNLQYVQFHPTTLYLPNQNRFLLTEALRGEGAQLLTSTGRPFAREYHQLGELAPRDIVARMILAQMDKDRDDCMYLDISQKDSSWLKDRFPTIYEYCLNVGIDMTKQPLPVVPAAHYHCGGVHVNLSGETTVRGLFAAGEVACTGLHGANRLASTSLLEGLVWGASVAETVASIRDVPLDLSPIDYRHGGDVESPETQVAMLNECLRRLMWEKVGPVRTMDGLRTAVEELSLLKDQVERMYHQCSISKETIDLRNAVATSKAIAQAAARDTVSIGTHYLEEDVVEPVAAVEN